MWRALAGKRFLGYIASVVVIAAATAVLRALGSRINPTTVALTFLLIILFVATAWGPKPAVLASLLGAACFNFFFLPPVGTFHIAHPENWIALLAFLITAMTVGQLSSRAKLRADEATVARQEIERLYQELQDTFERSSQAKALKQSERLKSALLDAVTHDLRTPLTSIKASVTMLLDDLVEVKRAAGERLGDEGRQEMLEVINEEADRLDRFIGSLMDLARIEAGEMQLRRQSIPLDGIIIAAMKRAEPRTRDHRIEISLDDQLPPVDVDEPALVEAVYVLVDNAAKYSQPGSTIKVSAQSKPGQRTARVVVEDQGTGIPQELRERVFDKFFRALRDGDHGQPSGTGMGLAIAHGIVEAHGGRIWIEDGPEGRGTKFILELPASGPVKYA